MTTDNGDGERAGDQRWSTFVEPLDEARPRAWWHRMDSNIDPAGIVQDPTRAATP